MLSNLTTIYFVFHNNCIHYLQCYITVLQYTMSDFLVLKSLFIIQAIGLLIIIVIYNDYNYFGGIFIIFILIFIFIFVFRPLLRSVFLFYDYFNLISFLFRFFSFCFGLQNILHDLLDSSISLLLQDVLDQGHSHIDKLAFSRFIFLRKQIVLVWYDFHNLSFPKSYSLHIKRKDGSEHALFDRFLHVLALILTEYYF